MNEQNNACAICIRSLSEAIGTGRSNDFCVDHDHRTNEVRGLLCRNCNSAIGHAGDGGDDIERLDDFIEYLNKNK